MYVHTVKHLFSSSQLQLTLSLLNHSRRKLKRICGVISVLPSTIILLRTMASGINIYSVFQVSEIVTREIRNKYFGYLK